MQCPNCKKYFGFGEDFFDESLICELEASTCYCFWCNSLLIIKNTFAHDFHQYINSQDKRWPADGKGTGYISV